MQILRRRIMKVIARKYESRIVVSVQSWMEIKEGGHRATKQAGFLQSLPPGGLLWRFGGIDLAARNLPGQAVHKQTVLPNEQNLPSLHQHQPCSLAEGIDKDVLFEVLESNGNLMN